MLTFRGSIILGSSLALLTAGVVVVNGVLMTLGLAGLLLLAGALIVSRHNLRHLALSLRGPSRVYAESPFDLRLTMTNKRSMLDAFRVGLEVELCRHGRLRADAPWTPNGSRSEVRIRGSIPLRGATTEHHFTLHSSFPLDLFQSKASGTITHEILAYPRPVTPQEFFHQGALHDAATTAGPTAGQAPGEPRGIRPWQPGDAAKHIHWPTSARAISRRQNLRIRENDPPGFLPHHCTVIVHSYGTTGELIRADRFERALSLTCGTLHHLRRLGIPTTLVADFLNWHPQPTTSRGAFGATLTALAQATRCPDTEAHNLAATLAEVPSNHALILISDMPPEAWAGATTQRSGLIIDIRQHRRPPVPLQTPALPSHA